MSIQEVGGNMPRKNAGKQHKSGGTFIIVAAVIFVVAITSSSLSQHTSSPSTSAPVLPTDGPSTPLPTDVPQSSPSIIPSQIMTTNTPLSVQSNSIPKNKAVVQTASLNVRSGPDTSYSVLGTLSSGDEPTIKGTNADFTWFAIDFQGRTGWVSASLIDYPGDPGKLAVLSAPPTRQALNPPPTVPPANAVTTGNNNPGNGCPSMQYTCDQLTCAQAYACLAAGNKKLDGDGDGRPCESVCK